MRLLVPIIACQFGLLVLGKTNDNIAEINLITPYPNSTYQMSGDHRFPIVWALHQPDLWHDKVSISWQLSNITQSGNSTAYYGNVTFSNKFVNEKGVQFATFDALLIDTGIYNLKWGVRSPYLDCADATLDQQVDFSTNQTGARADLLYAATDNCFDRSTVAYNIANITDKCFVLDEDDPYPNVGSTCDVDFEGTIFKDIQGILDAQYNSTCAKPESNYLCPQKKSAASQLGVGTLLLGLPLAALFL